MISSGGNPNMAGEIWPEPITVGDIQPTVIERDNLFTVVKLVIRDLLDSAISHGRCLDCESFTLRQFFTVMEHIFMHGLKERRSLLSSLNMDERKEFWSTLKAAERIFPEFSDVVTSARDIPDIASSLGRGRAFLRIAMMQKRLADLVRLIVTSSDHHSNLLSDYYDSNAFLRHEEYGMVVCGLLLGLNVIDLNLCLKGDDLDQPLGAIDYCRYIKASSQPLQQTSSTVRSSAVPSSSKEDEEKLSAALDQNNYLEELNAKLRSAAKSADQKIASLESVVKETKAELAEAKTGIIMLNEQIELLQVEKQSALQHIEQNQGILESLASSQKAGVSLPNNDERHSNSAAAFENEIQSANVSNNAPQRVEISQEEEKLAKELQLQILMRREVDTVVNVLKKEAVEFEDRLADKQNEIDEMKAVNLELYRKLQEAENSLQHKSRVINQLEKKAAEMRGALERLGVEVDKCRDDKKAAEETQRQLGHLLAEKDNNKSTLESDLKLERQCRLELQQTVDEEKNKSKKLQAQLQRLGLEKDTFRMQLEEMQKRHSEQETALAELGSQLGQTKAEAVEVRNKQQHLMQYGGQWQDDSDITRCKLCEKEFSLARRKHHCRQCGGVFCNDCSDNRMVLSSSSKPLRVCDSCNALLLERYAAR